MALRKVLIASAVLILGQPAAVPAQGSPKTVPQKDCPHGFSDREGIVKTMGDAATCAESLEIFQACASGAGGDTEFGEAVVARCEKDFAGRLSPAQQRAYDAARGRCDRKYAKKQGTMYVSFTAFCHAEVALTYARRHGPRAPQRK